MRPILLFVFLFFYQLGFGQLFTETFENATVGSTSFNSNGINFIIASGTDGERFEVADKNNSFLSIDGWSGSAVDNKYIDNTISFGQDGSKVIIKSSAGENFIFKSIYLYLYSSTNASRSFSGGSLTIQGKENGNIQYTANITSGFNTTNSNSGFTFIDMSSFGGQNNSGVIVDEIVISVNSVIDYLAIDAFKWYKYLPSSALSSSVYSQGNVSCNGASNGSATVQASGGIFPYSYSWSPSGGTSSTATNLSAGTYSCRITDAAGVSISQSVTISQPSAITATTGVTNVSCNGGSNGIVSIQSVSGGVGGYTYYWNPGNGSAASLSNRTAGTYSCTITDANACTLVKTVTVNEPAVITATSSFSGVTCYGGNNGSATISSVSGGVVPYTYSWSPNGGTAATATGLIANTYTCIITDNNSCQITKSITVTQPSELINSITSGPICLGDLITVNASSSATQTVWKRSGTTVLTNTNLTTVSSAKEDTYRPSQSGTYNVVVSNAAGCSATSSDVVVNTTSLSSNAISQTNSVSTDTYFKTGCSDLIARITPIGGGTAVNGSVTAKVWIESVQPSTSGTQYVKRHYELTPSLNQNTATGRVTLFFTQAEFDDFNMVSAVKLPTGSNDASGKANLLIEKRSGTSSNSTGLPNTYSGSVSNIDPVDADIVWNSTDSRWEVSFDVTGFSGFFVKTNSASLPVQWLTISGFVSNGSLPVLSFKVNEWNVSRYVIEKSIDARMFTSIETIPSKGNGIQSYQYEGATAISSPTYFRIKQIDIDGQYSYSSVLKLQSTATIQMKVYPTPFKETITVVSPQVQIARIYAINGQVVKEIELSKGNNVIPVEELKSGQYFFQSESGYKQKLIKQ